MASGPPPLTGVTVLIVEDDEATRYIFSRHLAQTGASVTLVEDGEAALRVLGAASVDVLVVDLKLPGLDGFKLLALAPTRPPVTIAVSAFDDNEMRERVATAGFNAYIPKPVQPEMLIQEIARHVGSQG
jgi:CheY-like chemotaxis protein